MFNLYVDLIIYSMALKSPDGELSLEVVLFFLYFFNIHVLSTQRVKCGVLRHEHVQTWDPSIIRTLQF